MKRARSFALLIVLAALGAVVGPAAPAGATVYVPISGAGSTWSQNALDQWRRNVNQYGMQINYQGTGSSDGRNQFRNGTIDFGVTEIPYGLKDGGVYDSPPSRGYAYMPIVAGGTSFMYNLKIGGHRVTNLRLSGLNVAKIFTGVITRWDDPALKADNPGLALPARRVVPVVRSDGSGTTAQLTTWLSKRYQSLWDPYCARAGRPTPCGITSNYPLVAGSGFTAQSGSLGVSGYVAQSQSEGAITYVEYSYAVNTGFPIAKLLNKSGYYVEPTASNVAVALLKATIQDKNPQAADYLTQNLEGVYDNGDPRAYPLSSYSYMIVPTKVEGSFSESKGKTLGAFAYYFLCEGQQQAPILGYSPLPINLVRAGLQQVKRIPGVAVESVDITKCDNPTFSSDGSNTLAKNAPQPPACDKQGPTQCATGTGGAKQTTRPSAGNGAGQPSVGGTDTVSAGGGAATGSRGGGTVPTTPGGAGGSGTGAVDPETGTAPQPAAANSDITSVPLTLAAERSSGRGIAAVAALLLVAVVVGPPLLARRLATRRGGRA